MSYNQYNYSKFADLKICFFKLLLKLFSNYFYHKKCHKNYAKLENTSIRS